MSNNISNTKNMQKQFKEKLKEERKQWKKDIETIQEEKKELGYKHILLKELMNNEFIENLINSSTESTTPSALIELRTKYKELIEKYKQLWPEDYIIKEFNKIHAVVHIDQTYILTEKDGLFGGKDFTLESRASFKAFYEDEVTRCSDGKTRCKANIWLKSPKRRKYKGITFDPTTTKSNDSYYNLWKGFARNAKKGNCSKYWTHIKDNICNGNEESYKYVRKWLAYVFQHPDVVHTALVLCGSQGVGKNSFVEPLGVLFGSHYAPLSSISELVSNFNYHLKNAVLIHANEALWGGNKKEIGTVKTMITDNYCLIEGKGKDRIRVCNFKHIILSSNEDWPVHLDPDDRRFFVLPISDKRKEDHEHFKQIQDELDNGGYEALLYDLLNEDLAGFNPRKIPSSSNSFSIKMRSAGSPHRYIYEVLFEGGFSIDNEDGNPVWQAEMPKISVYQDYTAWCENNGESKLSNALFGRVIKKLIASIEDSRPGNKSRPRCYKLPPLKKAREDFCKAFKEDPKKIFEQDDIEE